VKPVLVNLDGRIVPPAEAVISVLDRGFLFGDSVYEVVRTYRRRPFELPAHLARLRASAARIGLELPWDDARTAGELARGIAAFDGVAGPVADDAAAAPWNRGELSARIVMTRGAGDPGLDPALAADPRALVILTPVGGPTLDEYRRGVQAVLVAVDPAAPATDPNAKTGGRLRSVLAMRAARAQGAHEAIWVDAAGLVTEGASSNVFCVRGGRVETPPLAIGLLAGVTRAKVLAIARRAGVIVAEVPLRPPDLESADEIFLTSTARELLPVTRLGDRPVGTGAPGPVHARLHALFRELAEAATR
jgi:branched-chain amino acid aminotransferase